MPSFIEQLDVPVVVITDSQTNERLYIKDNSLNSHFATQWDFSEVGFKLASSEETLFAPMEDHQNLHELFYSATDV